MFKIFIRAISLFLSVKIQLKAVDIALQLTDWSLLFRELTHLLPIPLFYVIFYGIPYIAWRQPNPSFIFDEFENMGGGCFFYIFFCVLILY